MSGTQQELTRDLEVGQDANWDAGSTLYFWRWPKRCRLAVRDGTKLFVDKSKLPHYMKRQQWPSDDAQHDKLMSKLRSVWSKGYIQPGFVKSLTSFFAVPKAGTDIRVVYDAIQCGLNDALWAPNFFLPTVDSILRNAYGSTWFGDIDLGEMFLNYALDLIIRQNAGVDINELDAEKVGSTCKHVLERWTRRLIDFKPSPYVCTQTFAWSEEIILGDVSELENPLYWDRLVLNLPGMEKYDPTMPRVYR